MRFKYAVKKEKFFCGDSLGCEILKYFDSPNEAFDFISLIPNYSKYDEDYDVTVEVILLDC